MSTKTMTLSENSTGRSVELPLHEGTEGPEVVDISTLYREMGIFTYDPGFVSTASWMGLGVSSAITP